MRIDKQHKKENNYNEPAHIQEDKKAKQEAEERKRVEKLKEKPK
jgi:hypothetical protein